MILGDIGQELLNEYASVLNIDIKKAEFIINSNKTMKTFLQQEEGLKLTSKERNLSLLLRGTLGRKMYDFSPITNVEIELIKTLLNYKTEVL